MPLLTLELPLELDQGYAAYVQPLLQSMSADTTVINVLSGQQSPGLAPAESRSHASALHVSAAGPQRQSMLPHAVAASVPLGAKMSQQGSALDGHLERCQRFAATGQLSSGCLAEVAAAARPLLQAVEGALAELSKLLHLLLMHCGKLVIMLLLLLGTQLSSKAATVLCCYAPWSQSIG